MHLLVGVDGTDGSLQALDETIARVRETGDDLTVAVLVDADHVDDAAETYARDAVADLDADVRRLDGPPAARLVELADGGEFDRLVIGGGTRSPLGKVNLDSLMEFVLLNSNTSVTLIR